MKACRLRRRSPLLDLVDLLGRPGVFFAYAALAFGALLFARALVPETKGLSLEAVEALRRSAR